MTIPEFRLYYDDNGDVLFYTCDKPEGNYIIVDSETYVNCRFDIRIINGKIEKINDLKIICKLTPDLEGTSCYKDDVSIVYDGSNSKKWKLKINEFN